MILCTISYIVLEFAIAKFPYDESFTDSKGQKHTLHIEQNEVNSYYRVTDGKHTMTHWVRCETKNQTKQKN